MTKRLEHYLNKLLTLGFKFLSPSLAASLSILYIRKQKIEKQTWGAAKLNLHIGIQAGIYKSVK